MRTKNPALREDMRDQILDAAYRLIERYGYRKTTIDDVAREAGIGKGTIYLYFPSKEEVALSCMDRSRARIYDQLRGIASSSGTPAERLRRMLVARVMLRFDAVQHVAHALDELLTALRGPCMERRERYFAEEAGIFAEVLIEGRLLGAFDVEDAVRTAEILLIATNAMMPGSLLPRELANRDEVEHRACRAADLLLRGVQCR